MREFELIKNCFTDWGIPCPGLKVGIGDDCLIWQSDKPLAVSTDTAVAGVHFPVKATGAEAARRAFLPALSDLAAMAATPAFFTLAVSLPASIQDTWLIEFAQQLRDLARHYGIALAGGDTTRSDVLVITVSVHGVTEQPVLRSQAKPEDDVWVTGCLGGAAAALPTILNPGSASCCSEWLEAYWMPALAIEFAQQAGTKFTSAIDISDGLIGDAAHIARASEAALHIDLARLPLATGLKEQGDPGLKLALAGGDDYQLLFTASKAHREDLVRLAAQLDQRISRIGRVEAGEAKLYWYHDGQPVSLPWQSYQHF